MAEGNVSNDFSLKLCEPHLAGNVVIVVDEEQYEHEQTRIACSEIYLQCVQLEGGVDNGDNNAPISSICTVVFPVRRSARNRP